MKKYCYLNNKGASAILVGLMIFILIGVAAFAIDIGHLAVVRNQLRNASDAGALAGALYLYNNDGTVNTGANLMATDTAEQNKSDAIPVEVLSVERGHWNIITGLFTPNDNTAAPILWGVSTETLNNDTNFINAVRVTTAREATPAQSFFARIFGHSGFTAIQNSVAWIGFPATLDSVPGTPPIVICQDSIVDDSGTYTCNEGRMINSGINNATNQTGAWSNFEQGDASGCTGTDPTNPPTVSPLLCSDAAKPLLKINMFMSVTNGMTQVVFGTGNTTNECTLLYQWKHASVDINDDNEPDTPIDRDTDGKPDLPWGMTVPVVDCSSGGPNCMKVVGAVNVNILWITEGGEDPGYINVPRKMEDWTCSQSTGEACWNEFVTHFHLLNKDSTPAAYAKKSIYFKPDCTPHIPEGISGGANFGVLARIPLLVQ